MCGQKFTDTHHCTASLITLKKGKWVHKFEFGLDFIDTGSTFKNVGPLIFSYTQIF